MVDRHANIGPLLRWIDALADGTRLRLLRLLERHELSVAEMCEVLQLPQSTVSRHLKVLGAAGYLRSRRHATTHLYTMPLDEMDPACRKLWQVAREQSENWPAVQQDALRLERRLRERQEASNAFFAGAAARWEKLRAELYGSLFTHTALLALLPASYVIADLGCGTGSAAVALAPRVSRVIGVDNSAAMLKAARKRLEDFDNVELRQGELSRLPIEDATCDGALMLLALTYVPDVAGAIGEMARVLNPGGRAAIVDLLPHDRDDFRREHGQIAMGFGAKTLTAALKSAGMGDVSYEPLTPEAQAKGPALFLATGVRR